MAVKLIANYSKRLGLPRYSSHQFSVSVEAELMNVDDASGESERLYALLQKSVDEQMQNTGFVPPDGYGMKPNCNPGNGNGGNGRGTPAPAGDGWNCTEGQKGFVLRITNESKLDKQEVEQMAQQLFGIGVKQLDKMQASQLIEELLEKTGRKANGRRSPWQGRQPART